MELTGKELRHLRSLGQTVAVGLSVGKAGLTGGLIGQLGELLTRHELVKVRLPALPPAERKALAAQLAADSGAALAGLIGRNALIYRPNAELDPKRRIRLP